MVKNNECKVEINTRNKKYYNDKNYNCEVGDIISIDISTMSKKSKIKYEKIYFPDYNAIFL